MSLAYQHEDLWYIETRGDGDKRPQYKWGGYSQDFGTAEKVHSYEDIQKLPSESFAVCGVQDKAHMARSLLVFDLDVHKAEANDDSPEQVQIDDRVPLIKSQNGGFHVPFFVRCDKNSLNESDFGMTKYVSWDVDVKGSAVGGHVVAPGDIPGINSSYEIVRDTTIPTVSGPQDACERIQLYGDPLVEHKNNSGIDGDFGVDRDAEPPEEMPMCYHRGLQLRAANPDDHPNTHKVNTLAALCGLAAGYDIEAMVAHFCEEYPPGETADTQQTQYQLEHMARKMDRDDLAPPAVSTLREYGILEDDETCACEIPYHGHSRGMTTMTDGGTTVVESSSAGIDPHSSDDTDVGSSAGTTEARSSSANSLPECWNGARISYRDETAKDGRVAATNALEQATDWMYVMDSDNLWAYDDERGYFNPWGVQTAHRILERELNEHYSQTEAKEIIARLETRNQTRRKELNARSRDSPLLCVGNGVVNLESGEMMQHSPEYKFTRGLRWDYEPATADPESVIDFLDDVTKREADRDTLLDHLAHGLMPGHPYRAFVMMYGPGSNGKTRVGKLLRGFVGEENAASVELQDLTGDDSFATGGLPGAFVNVGDDISVGEIRDTSIIKSLTGDGTVRANEKYEKQYEFENEAAMFFSANEPPRIREKTEAISDRLYPIEMPYRFVDKPVDPDEKKKIPGIAESLLNDDAAMRGLLLLAVRHAQDVIERNGRYAMPEGPKERREMYESASDPIKRFALQHMAECTSDSIVLKSDAYTLYTEMCDREGERPASEDVFKQKVGEMASTRLESTRTRKLTPGDSREPAWRYIEFADSAKEFMPARLRERYTEGGIDGDETTQGPENALGASPLSTVAQSPTGYATVSVEVLKVEHPEGENAPALTATVKDETTAIDIVSWEDNHILAPGDTVLVENAELTEYNGKTQLQIDDAVTEIQSIQAGTGHTEMATPAENQEQLSNTAADGGDEIADTTGTVKRYIATQCEKDDTVTVPGVASQCSLQPGTAETTLEKIAKTTMLLESVGDGWKVLQ